jgi:hypothetical protein
MESEKDKASKRQDSPDNLRGQERADEVHKRNQERKEGKEPDGGEEPTEETPAEGTE